MYIDDNYVGDIEAFWGGENKYKDLKLHKCADGAIKCINGTHPKYDCMMNDHLLNTIKWIERHAKNGLEIDTGPMPADIDMMTMPVTIYGDEVLKRMNYKIYIAEAKKRKIR